MVKRIGSRRRPKSRNNDYKSLGLRERRAVELVARWGDVVYHEPAADSDRELYYFNSDRAPSCPFPGFEGCWTVAVRKAPKPPDLPPIPPPPPLPLPGGGGNGGSPTTVYIGHLSGTPAGWVSGLPAWIQSADESVMTIPTSGVVLPWITAEVTPGFTIVDAVYGVNGPKIETTVDVAGRSLAELEADGIGYWVRNIKIYLDVDPTSPLQNVLVLYRYVGATYPPAYSATFSYDLPTNTGAPLVSDGPADNYPAAPQVPIDPGAPPPNYDPTPPPEDPDLEEPSPDDQPDQAEYECNCPDAAMTWGGDESADEESDRYERDWRGSEAGAPMDADGVRLCKHVLAVKMYRGEW